MDYIKELDNIKTWIKNLIIIQYRQAPKNRALIDEMVDLLFMNCLPQKIRDLCLNVEESIGAQLDVVGKWVGVDRVYTTLELFDHPYLAFPTYKTIKDNTFDDLQGGFSSYQNFSADDGGFLMYKRIYDVKSNVNQMGDDYYRKIIKLKIIKNSINYTRKEIDEAIWKWSEGNVYTTWNTMKVKYNYNSDYKTIITLAQYKDVIPVPTGCELEFEEV